MAAVIFLLSVWPVPPAAARAIGPLDKLIHVCEYALLAWCLVHALVGIPPDADTSSAAWNVPPRSHSHISLATVFLLSTGYGALLEAVQSVLPYRSGDWRDAVANAVGAVIGLWFAR